MEKKKYSYVARIHHDEEKKNSESWWCEFPDIEGCLTCSLTRQKLISEAQDALASVLLFLIDSGAPIPPATPIFEFLNPDKVANPQELVTISVEL